MDKFGGIEMSNSLLKKAETCFLHMNILIELSNGKKLTGYGMINHLKKFGFKISPGTVYHQLDTLLEKGIIRGEKQPWGKNSKTIYQMTKKGKELARHIEGAKSLL